MWLWIAWDSRARRMNLLPNLLQFLRKQFFFLFLGIPHVSRSQYKDSMEYGLLYYWSNLATCLYPPFFFFFFRLERRKLINFVEWPPKQKKFCHYSFLFFLFFYHFFYVVFKCYQWFFKGFLLKSWLYHFFFPINSSTHLKLSNIREKKFHKLLSWQIMIEVILLLNRFIINIIFNMH